jgi:2-dehydro-3-deoxygalactonokinase
MNTFLGCDWGTSSFRLRLVERGTRRILAEQAELTGVRYFAALNPSDRATRFAAHLADRIGRWPEVGSEVPFIVTGMASSSVGWQELPYAQVPFHLDGRDAVVDRLILPAGGGRERPGFLVSGVRTADEIMRGEETALIGWQALRAGRDGSAGPVRCLLAGTHPKHARVQASRLESFRTHLTGELFDVLSSGSILAASVGEAEPVSVPDEDQFLAGVRCARELGVSAALFQVRARHVLAGSEPRANRWFLSGVLIGGELERLAAGEERMPVSLIGDPHRVALYRAALRVLCPSVADAGGGHVLLSEAVVAGQDLLLQRHAAALEP